MADYGDLKFAIYNERDTSDEIYTITEDPASFPGGHENMIKILWDHLIEYPEDPGYVDPAGKVYIESVIQPNGEVTQVKILGMKGVTSNLGNPKLNDAILKGFEKLPDFLAAKQRRRNVAVKIVYAIAYR